MLPVRCAGETTKAADKGVTPGQLARAWVLARGEQWFAVSLYPGTTLPEGTTVVVADVERGLLVVYPVADG